MDFSVSVLGSRVAEQLQERVKAGILNIGGDSFSRRQLARVDCFNFIAASNLSYILNKELKVKDTRDVYDNVPPHALALPRLGSISLAVLGAAFEAKGIGGDAPLENWMKKHMKDADHLVTFGSIKHRDQKIEADERKRARARKQTRRNIAHATRVARFERRATAANS